MSQQARTRLETLRSAPMDSWIAISEDESRIIAFGKTYAEVCAKTDEAGEPDAVILKTPPEWEPMSVLFL